MLSRPNPIDQFAAFLVNTVRLAFPSHHQCQLFPAHYLLQLLKHFKDYTKPGLHLVAVSTEHLAHLIQDEYIKSSHYIIVPEVLFEKLNRSDQPNWANIMFASDTTTCESGKVRADILSSILNANDSSLLVPMLAARHPIESNRIIVGEEFYNNCIRAQQLPSNRPIFVALQPMHTKQNLPKVATKATISLLDTPHELSNDFIDTILSLFFRCPQLLYPMHTYTVSLTKAFLGHKLYARHFDTVSRVEKVYFQCTDFEVAANSASIPSAPEKCTIVAKQLTNLHLNSCTHFSVPYNRPTRLTHLNRWSSVGTALNKHFNRLKESIRPFLPRNANFSSRQIHPTFLVQGDRGVGKSTLMKAVAKYYGMQLYSVDCVELMSQIGAQMEAKIRNVLSKVIVCQPVLIVLHNFEVIGVQKEGREDVRIITMFQNEIQTLFNNDRQSTIIFAALTCDKHTKPFIRRLFLETIRIDAPTKTERFDILKLLHAKEMERERLLQSEIPDTKDGRQAQLEFDILAIVSGQSQGFSSGDLHHLYSGSVKQMKIDSGTKIEQKYFDANLATMLGDFTDNLGVPNVPKVLWSDIGGLAKLKDEIQSSIGLPLTHLNLMGQNCRRSGILLYGPPGTGKTLVAKAVATECNLNFLSVQGPELLNMYVGQSEQNVREVFDRARTAAPCVIFLDELDSLAPNRGVAGDSGGVMDRVVSQLLAEMDKMVTDFEKGKQIFILAATNRPDLIDSALLRPGRFDKFLYVQPCSTVEDKVAVLNAQTKKFKLANGLNTETIAEIIDGGVTGADLYSICSNAWMNGVRREIARHKENGTPIKNDNVIVTMDDFTVAVRNFVPSITAADISYFNKIKNVFN